MPKGHNPNRKKIYIHIYIFRGAGKRSKKKNTHRHTGKIMSEKLGKVTPQDSHKWMGNTFGVNGVKCEMYDTKRAEMRAKGKKGFFFGGE